MKAGTSTLRRLAAGHPRRVVSLVAATVLFAFVAHALGGDADAQPTHRSWAEE